MKKNKNRKIITELEPWQETLERIGRRMQSEREKKLSIKNTNKKVIRKIEFQSVKF